MTSDPGGSSNQPFSERRRVPRYAVSWSAGLFEPNHSPQINAQAVDLSLTGCRIVDVLDPIEPNTILRIQIQKDSESLDLWARVVRFADHRGLGLSFLRTRPEDEGMLLRWIADELADSQPNSEPNSRPNC